MKWSVCCRDQSLIKLDAGGVKLSFVGEIWISASVCCTYLSSILSQLKLNFGNKIQSELKGFLYRFKMALKLFHGDRLLYGWCW